MKNLKHHSNDAFEFHLEVIQRKHTTKDDLTYKVRVSSHDIAIKNRFKKYDNHFSNNSLELIEKYDFSSKDKEDLHKLYSYKSKRLQELKNEVTTTSSGRIINTCQNCTISEISSFDHLVPSSEFAEFAVNPKNLFPSCTRCNSYKSTAWRENGNKIFLNLYLDKLPKKQYLFVKTTVDGSIVKPTFYLSNISNIETSQFELLSNHYTRLHLFERFAENCAEVVINLTNSIDTYLGSMAPETIIKTSIQISEKNKLAFGHNFWKSILEIELMQNSAFLSRFLYKTS